MTVKEATYKASSSQGILGPSSKQSTCTFINFKHTVPDQQIRQTMTIKVTPGETTHDFEALLETESSVMYFLCEPGISTISFFKGACHEESLNKIRERIKLICQSNPWLTGRLVKNKKIHANVLLAVPKVVSEDDINSILCSEDSTLSSISSKMDYETTCKTLENSNALVKMGYSLIGKDSRVAKFTLVKGANNELALVFSLSHSVGDGFTYYSIFNMLTEGSEIKKLSYSRKHDFMPQMKKAMGEEEFQLMRAPGITLGMMSGMCCGAKARFEARFVDEEKVRKAKDEAKARVGSDDFFCSTNDILTSTFAQAAQADLLLMAINLRNRVEVATNEDSGNYETVLVYDSPSSANPEAIRKSLNGGAPFKRIGGESLPGFFKQLRTRFALITNWAFASFKADLKLCDKEGNMTCETQLHIPVYTLSAIFFPLAIIFRPCEGKLAILYGGSFRDLPHDRIVSCGVPLGDVVSETMFG